MQTVSLRASRQATKPMRRMFVSRSSLLKPRPLLRFVRITSPSSSSTLSPRCRIVFCTRLARVVLPAPESPVNQRVKPVLPMSSEVLEEVGGRKGMGSAHLGLEERHLEDLLVHDRPVSEVAALAEELAVVGGHGDEGVLGHEVVELGEDDAVEVLDRVDLPRAELVELVLVEELGRVLVLDELAPDDLAVEVLEHAVEARDARPVLGVLV